MLSQGCKESVSNVVSGSYSTKLTMCFLLLLSTAPTAFCISASTTDEEDQIPYVASGPEHRREFPDYEGTLRFRQLKAVACGPLSLLTILRRMDVPLSKEDVEKMVATAKSRGTNLLQLKNLAEGYGLHASGLQLNTQQLKRMGLYAIVQFDWSHFVAVIGYTRDGIQIAEPINEIRIMTDKEFAERFTGRALVISRIAFSIPSSDKVSKRFPRKARRSGPALRLSQRAIALGRINLADWQRSIEVYNDGSEPLEIKDVIVSCACASAVMEPNVLNPGESGTLTVRATEKTGRFTHKLTLVTNEKDAPVVNIQIHGYLAPPAVLKIPAVTLTDIPENQKAQTHVPFVLIEGTRVEDLAIRIPKGAPLTTKIRRSDTLGHYLEIRWEGAEPGWHRYRIEIRRSEFEGKVATPVLLAVHVVPSVEVFPSSLVIPQTAVSGEWSRKLVFRFNDTVGKEFKCTWSNELFSEAVDVKPVVTENGGLSVVLSPKSTQAMQTIEGCGTDLTFHFSSSVRCIARVRVRPEVPLPSRRKEAMPMKRI
jgi:predicted double-glycine peptidase